jgi:hypothetical protein
MAGERNDLTVSSPTTCCRRFARVRPTYNVSRFSSDRLPLPIHKNDNRSFKILETADHIYEDCVAHPVSDSLPYIARQYGPVEPVKQTLLRRPGEQDGNIGWRNLLFLQKLLATCKYQCRLPIDRSGGSEYNIWPM